VLRLLKRKKPSIEAPAEIGGVRVKASLRASRLTLRVDARIGDIVLTWPRGASEQGALRFITQHRDWIEQHRSKLPAPKVFAEGEVISVYGQDYEIVRRDGRGSAQLRHPAAGRGLVVRSTFINGGFAADQTPPCGGVADNKNVGHLIIHCRPEYLSRRVKDFLKEKAREVLEDVVGEKLSDINKKNVGIRVIDPKTRWGSCAPDGQMMFSWRLILAPPQVLDYVVAHEVAHRIHMNHSRKFWALCASLTEDAGASRRWLKANGNALMSYK
jgi:predicted metal-dependent hydrolase